MLDFDVLFEIKIKENNIMSQIPEKCLWQITTSKPEHYPKLDREVRVDVCVIGSGFTGLSAALHLAEYGKSVCVLECQEIGSGGSGRNVGFVNAGTWAPPDDLNMYLGEKVGEKLTYALGLAPKLVFDLIDKHQINASDTRTGNLHMAHNAAAEADIDSRYSQLTRRGANVEIITGSKCHEYTGTTRINKALLDKRAGTINPFAYVIGLSRAAAKLGVKIFENTKVNELIKDGDKWCIKSENGQVLANKVIITTNAYTEGEWTDIQKSFYPVYYYQIASKPLENEIANRILPYKNGSWDTRMALSSIRRDDEGRILFGTVGGREFKPANFYLSWAKHVQEHYFPDLNKLDWQCQWFGKFGFTPDHIMRVFTPQDGIIAATAYNGRGITTGTMMGKAFADFIVHDNPDVLPLPFVDYAKNKLSLRTLRTVGTEIGLTLYHAGQCLKIIS